MALIDNTTYTGKDSDGFYSVALLTGNTKSKVRQVPNVKSSMKIGSLDLGDILQADGCAVPGSGNHTLAQKTLEVCPIAIKVPICISDYEANYLSESMKPGSNVDENFPGGFKDYLLDLVAKKISEETEELFWQGDTVGSPATECDGIFVKLNTDQTVKEASGATTLSKSNIIGEIEKVVDLIPETISESGKVAIFISPRAAMFYRQALVAANPAIIAYNQGDYSLKYLDFPLIVAPGMPRNKMLAADPMNLWYGFDLVNDENEVSIIKDPLNPKQHYIMGSFKWGVQYGVGSEIVTYGN